MQGGFFSSLPTGYRFKPKDEELVDFYLRRKINNGPLPPNLFRDVDLYNYDPCTLTAMSDNASSNGVVTEWYFFTPRDRRHPNGKRPCRTTGDGYWKATGMAKPVTSRGGEKIGSKRSLVFFRGTSSKGVKTDWLMHEYVLTKAPPRQRHSNQDMKLDDWVLCRVYKKKEQRVKPGTLVEGGCDRGAVVTSEAQVLGNGISPDALNTLNPQQTYSTPCSMPGQDPSSFEPVPSMSPYHQFQPQGPLPQQFSGVSSDTTQEGGDIGAVVGQSDFQMLGNRISPVDQYQGFVDGYLNMPMPQQQQLQCQLSGGNQSQPLQQQQLSGVDQSQQLLQQQFPVVNQSEVQMLWNGISTIVQYQEFDAGALNMPMPQQQQVQPLQPQLSGDSQCQPLQQQLFSGVNQSEVQMLGNGISPTLQYQGEGDITEADWLMLGAVVGQSGVHMLGNGISTIDQYQEFDAGSLNILPVPQQQQVPPLQCQLSGDNQSQPLQHQQFLDVNQSQKQQQQQFSDVNQSGLNFTAADEFLLHLDF